jgi:pimeloyl-ACP methyl ester carboxylesterase
LPVPARLGSTLLATYIILTLIAGIALAEFSLHLPKMPVRTPESYRVRYKREFNAAVADVSITAEDGAILDGWYVTPPMPNGESVVLLHGIGGNRVEISGYADIFLKRGYSVLLPDSRAHGASGGSIATYGILERDDVQRWAAWLHQRNRGCTYLLGESMGAAIALEATAVTPQLCAVAVESPYASFRRIAIERLGWQTHLGSLFWSTLGRPAIEVAIAWTRLRYRIWLPDASPIDAVQHSRVPVLLIAGTRDEDIRMHNAQEIQSACGAHCALWIVNGATHGGAATVAPDEFHYRVANWFATHDPLANTMRFNVPQRVGLARGR